MAALEQAIKWFCAKLTPEFMSCDLRIKNDSWNFDLTVGETKVDGVLLLRPRVENRYIPKRQMGVSQEYVRESGDKSNMYETRRP
jgi:hypothetical protein